ncbi:hypothetical protein BH23GEM9_BH23GEM9_32270 [soil metagenome]
MISIDPAQILPFALLMFVAASLAVAVRGALRARVRTRRRVVERPNSHYTSQLVRNSETRHRWHGIALESIHEVNRGEVVRLLARVEAAGVDSLLPAERVFLDQFTEAPPPAPAADTPENSPQMAPDLRHRPA